MILPDFHLLNSDPALALFQPHLSVLVSKNMPHKNAFGLLEAYFVKDGKGKEQFSKIWTEFIAPWFGIPTRWEGDDDMSGASLIKFSAGQRVRTAVGDGQIVSVVEGKTPRYLVKFSYGVGYVKPSAVAHLLPLSSSEMDTSAAYTSALQLMSDDTQVLFGTERIYVFMRLYILMVTMLYQAKDIIDRKNLGANKPIEGGYSGVVSSLQELVQGKVDAKDFEAECRKYVDKDVFNFVAIPPLVEACGEALIKVAKEDVLENLYHCSQLKLKVCVYS